MYNYIGILLEGRERFEEESLHEVRQHQSSDGPDATTPAGTFLSNIQFPLFVKCK